MDGWKEDRFHNQILVGTCSKKKFREEVDMEENKKNE
jgi:hypothetical protein